MKGAIHQLVVILCTPVFPPVSGKSPIAICENLNTEQKGVVGLV